MKNFEFWCTKRCPGKEFISEFMYEFIQVVIRYRIAAFNNMPSLGRYCQGVIRY